MKYGAEVLAPGHTMPVFGAAQVVDVLTNYRDAICHVVRETVAGMNQGLDPVSIAADLQLPENLADKPYLQEFFTAASPMHPVPILRAPWVGLMGTQTSLGQLPRHKKPAE